MAIERTRELVHRFYEEIWNRWDEDLARTILSPAVAFRGSIGLSVEGHDGFIGYMRTIRTAFPDFHNRIDELIAEGDRAAAWLTYTGTHEGPLLGRPATGRRIAYEGAAFFQIEAGRIRRVRVMGDLWGLMQQIDPQDPGSSA